MTDLTAEPTIARSETPKREVLEIIAQATFEKGSMASYLTGQFGSAWYVEVPRHLNDIYEEVGPVAVRDIVNKLLDDHPSAELLWDAIFSMNDRLVLED